MADSKSIETRESLDAGNIGVSGENRHTSAHCKITARCDFCRGSKTLSEKWFDNLGVCKRHFT